MDVLHSWLYHYIIPPYVMATALLMKGALYYGKSITHEGSSVLLQEHYTWRELSTKLARTSERPTIININPRSVIHKQYLCMVSESTWERSASCHWRWTPACLLHRCVKFTRRSHAILPSTRQWMSCQGCRGPAPLPPLVSPGKHVFGEP